MPSGGFEQTLHKGSINKAYVSSVYLLGEVTRRRESVKRDYAKRCVSLSAKCIKIKVDSVFNMKSSLQLIPLKSPTQ